jgi:hypothetical protein
MNVMNVGPLGPRIVQVWVRERLPSFRGGPGFYVVGMSCQPGYQFYWHWSETRGWVAEYVPSATVYTTQEEAETVATFLALGVEGGPH